MKYAHNYIGTQVKCVMAGRTFLGDVKDAYGEGEYISLIVKHFNGEPWPFDPNAKNVTILESDGKDLLVETCSHKDYTIRCDLDEYECLTCGAIGFDLDTDNPPLTGAEPVPTPNKFDPTKE